MLRGRLITIGGPKAWKRGLGKYVKEGLQQAALHWWKNALPEHFKSGAKGKYKYAKRTRKYQASKRKAKGHNLPLVWSGEMRDALLRRIDVKGTSRMATGTMRGPSYTGIIHNSRTTGARIDKVAEILATTNREVRDALRFVQDAITEQMEHDETVEVREF